MTMIFYAGIIAIVLAAVYSLISKGRPYFTSRESFVLLLLALGSTVAHIFAERSDRPWLSVMNTVLFLTLVFAIQRIAGVEVLRNGMGRLEKYRARRR